MPPNTAEAPVISQSSTSRMLARNASMSMYQALIAPTAKPTTKGVMRRQSRTMPPNMPPF